MCHAQRTVHALRTSVGLASRTVGDTRGRSNDSIKDCHDCASSSKHGPLTMAIFTPHHKLSVLATKSLTPEWPAKHAQASQASRTSVEERHNRLRADCHVCISPLSFGCGLRIRRAGLCEISSRAVDWKAARGRNVIVLLRALPLSFCLPIESPRAGLVFV